jgi:hypothetical protein
MRIDGPSFNRLTLNEWREQILEKSSKSSPALETVLRPVVGKQDFCPEGCQGVAGAR